MNDPTTFDDQWDAADVLRAADRDDRAHEAAESVDPFPTPGYTRHVLDVTPAGALLVEHIAHADTFPHHGYPVLGRPRCLAVAYALVDFQAGATTPEPGRYWCDVEPDGNFSIGSRLEVAS